MPKSRKVTVVVPDPALPHMCFYRLGPDLAKALGRTVVCLVLGEDGYRTEGADKEPWSDEAKMAWNERMVITQAQMEAMYCGSVFGWDSPAARVAFWERALKKQGRKVRAALDSAMREWQRAGDIPPADLEKWIEPFDLGGGPVRD